MDDTFTYWIVPPIFGIEISEFILLLAGAFWLTMMMIVFKEAIKGFQYQERMRN